VSYAAGRSRADLDDDELLRLALTKLVEIVGEVAKHISDDLRESCPEVPWSAAWRMRDRLIHHYGRALEHSDRRSAPVIGNSSGRSHR
jgi:uncharacterized protein with HEPN domain